MAGAELRDGLDLTNIDPKLKGGRAHDGYGSPSILHAPFSVFAMFAGRIAVMRKKVAGDAGCLAHFRQLDSHRLHCTTGAGEDEAALTMMEVEQVASDGDVGRVDCLGFVLFFSRVMVENQPAGHSSATEA